LAFDNTRGQENKIQRIASVEGQVRDAFLVDDSVQRGSGGFNLFHFGYNLHFGGHPSDGHNNWITEFRIHTNLDTGNPYWLETFQLGFYLVSSSNNVVEYVPAGVVGQLRTADTCQCVRQKDIDAGNHGACFVLDVTFDLLNGCKNADRHQSDHC